MTEVFICDAVRTPIGRYAGGLSGMRADDLGAEPLRALLSRNVACDPAEIDSKGRRQEFVADEHPRPDMTIEAVSMPDPLLGPDSTVTAGNAAGTNDGAAAVLIASQKAARRHGLRPRARILGIASASLEPRFRGVGPVPAK